MAPQQDLVKIGLEGFALIDTYYGAPTKRTTNGGFNGRQKQGCKGIQIIQDQHSKEELIINSKDAAYYFGGVMAVNYPKTRPQSRWGKVFKAFKA